MHSSGFDLRLWVSCIFYSKNFYIGVFFYSNVRNIKCITWTQSTLELTLGGTGLALGGMEIALSDTELALDATE